MNRILPIEQITSYVGREYGKSEWLTIRHTIDIEGRTDPACLIEMLRMYVTDAAPRHDGQGA